MSSIYTAASHGSGLQRDSICYYFHRNYNFGMHKYKSSPLLTFERKLSFNRKTDRQCKRVRFQSSKRDACGVRNPFAKHCGEINFLPQELLQFISSM